MDMLLIIIAIRTSVRAVFRVLVHWQLIAFNVISAADL